MTEKIQTSAEGTERKHFTIIPNMIIDFGLSPQALALYVRIKRRSGDDGACWENTRHLAEGLNMSVGKVSASKKELKEAGLIIIRKEHGYHGDCDLITPVDVWEENKRSYNERKSPNGEPEGSYSELN